MPTFSYMVLRFANRVNYQKLISRLIMTSVDISQADYAKQLIQHLVQDKTFNIELKEASNVFLEKSVETYYDFMKKVSVAAYLIVLSFIFLNPGNRMLVYLLKISEVYTLKQIIQLLPHKTTPLIQ